MLAADEYFPGCLCDATPITLFWPSNSHEPPTLVVAGENETLIAIVLEGTHSFVTFDCSANTSWRGLLIPNVTIEVDEKSIFSTDRYDKPLGAITRKGNALRIAAKSNGGFRTACDVPLLTNLSGGREDVGVSFTKWRVVLGEGPLKRELKLIEQPKPRDD